MEEHGRAWKSMEEHGRAWKSVALVCGSGFSPESTSD